MDYEDFTIEMLEAEKEKIKTELKRRRFFNGEYAYAYEHQGKKNRNKPYCVKTKRSDDGIWIGSFETVEEANNAAADVESVHSKYVRFRKG